MSSRDAAELYRALPAPALWVANLIGQRGLSPAQGQPPIRYEAIRHGLRRVETFASERSASVHLPSIGCGLAGSKWDAIEPLIIESCASDECRSLFTTLPNGMTRGTR